MYVCLHSMPYRYQTTIFPSEEEMKWKKWTKRTLSCKRNILNMHMAYTKYVTNTENRKPKTQAFGIRTELRILQIIWHFLGDFDLNNFCYTFPLDNICGEWRMVKDVPIYLCWWCFFYLQSLFVCLFILSAVPAPAQTELVLPLPIFNSYLMVKSQILIS